MERETVPVEMAQEQGGVLVAQPESIKHNKAGMKRKDRDVRIVIPPDSREAKATLRQCFPGYTGDAGV
jgi:hypothetical protein